MDRTVQHAFDPQEIMAYLDGELEPQRASALAGHLVDCAECQQVARNFRSISERLLDFEVEPTPEHLIGTVLEAINSGKYPEEIIQAAAGRKHSWLGRRLAKPFVWAFAGASVGIAILVIGVSIVHRNETARPLVALSTLPEYTASQTGRREAFERLGDGGVADGGGGGNLVAPAPPLSSGELQAPEPVGPMIAQTSSLSIAAKNYDEASGAIERLASEHGGYVEKFDARAQTGNARSLSASLRIPAKQLDAFLTDLRKLGHVEQESRSNEEVSAQYVDLQARLRSAQSTEKRLIELLGTRTGKLSDVLEAERELARIRGEIESMQAQNAILVHRVNYATVQVELSEEYRERLGTVTSNGTKIWNASVEGFANLEASAVTGLAFLLAYGPPILFWLAIFLIPAWFLWKRGPRAHS